MKPNDILTGALQRLVAQQDLTETQAHAVLGEIMDGRAGDVQIAAVLAALRAKGESPAEIVGFARAMTERAERVELDADVILDTCGTGGDGAGTFNISTAAAFVAAGAGALVAKHGNRSATSSCGSADVLERLGVVIDLAPAQVSACVAETGIGFMFAPRHHHAMAGVAPIRRQLGIRTIFNLVGPLTNPAGARHQLIGVSERAHVPVLAEAVRLLGNARNLVVHSEDGLDEMTTTCATHVVEVFAGRNEDRRYDLIPEDFGLRRSMPRELRGGDAPANARILREVLDGLSGPRLDIVLLNAGAALYIAEIASDIGEGVDLARAAVRGGAARGKLDALVGVTRRLAAEAAQTQAQAGQAERAAAPGQEPAAGQAERAAAPAERAAAPAEVTP